MTPIDEVEAEFRRQGVFLLVDFNSRKLWFYAYKRDQAVLRQLMESLTPRRDEMIKYLIARACKR